MKVFVPVSDDLLEKRGRGKLVPFDPEFLADRQKQDNRPANWISDCDYRSACKRLWESQDREAYQA
ncbi:MAG TPA: hypothetical protein VJ998_02830 [Pseudomonadales bacterium]|nr:hypothetical protein [Pseudomonadales bacterium]